MKHIIPAIQLIPAFKLASAYGHLWAKALGWAREVPADALPDGAVSVEDIVTWSTHYREEYNALAGVDAPYVNPDGFLEHATMTGRTRWLIEDDGTVNITISRPEGDVLYATVLGEEVLGVGMGEAVPYFQRHVEALREALAPLVGAEVAQERCAELVQGARDGQHPAEAARLLERLRYAVVGLQEGSQPLDTDALRIALSFLSHRAYRGDGSIASTRWPYEDVKAAIDRVLDGMPGTASRVEIS